MAEIIVLGAGMVGVSSAIALQERGHKVLLIDRLPPGSETSYGNAGLIQSEAVEPYAFPHDIKGLFRRAIGISPDIHWTLKGLHEWVGPVLKYFWYSSPSRYEAIARSYAEMIHEAIPAHERWMTASNAEGLITKGGWHQSYRTAKAFEHGAQEAERIKTRYGVPSSILSSAQIAAAVPNLKTEMAGAVHWSGAWACSNPQGLVQAYFHLYQSLGGQFEQGEAQDIAPNSNGWKVNLGERTHSAEHLVIALGPWSQKFLKGYLPNIVPKRGYHLHFPDAQGPNIPFMDAERATFMSPMAKGLRILTGAELGAADSLTAGRQIRKSVETSSELFSLGQPLETTPWHGNRPCMPDMLPRIGKVQNGLWVNTGHGHQGFTLGPASAKRLAKLFDA